MRDFVAGADGQHVRDVRAERFDVAEVERVRVRHRKTRLHVAPPSTVRTTVPLLPLAQATLSPDALTPRSLSVVGLTWVTQGEEAETAAPASRAAAIRNLVTAGILPPQGIATRAGCGPSFRRARR